MKIDVLHEVENQSSAMHLLSQSTDFRRKTRQLPELMLQVPVVLEAAAVLEAPVVLGLLRAHFAQESVLREQQARGALCPEALSQYP